MLVDIIQKIGDCQLFLLYLNKSLLKTLYYLSKLLTN